MPWVIDIGKIDSTTSSLGKNPLNHNVSQVSFSSDDTVYIEETAGSSNNVQETARSPNGIQEATRNSNDIQDTTGSSNNIQEATRSPNNIQEPTRGPSKREPIKRKPVPQLRSIPVSQPASILGEYPTECQPSPLLPPKPTRRGQMERGKLVDDNSAQQKKAPSESEIVFPTYSFSHACTCHCSQACTPDPKNASPVPTPKKTSPDRSPPRVHIKKTSPAPKYFVPL
jgi:hypothetical protein